MYIPINVLRFWLECSGTRLRVRPAIAPQYAIGTGARVAILRRRAGKYAKAADELCRCLTKLTYAWKVLLFSTTPLTSLLLVW